MLCQMFILIMYLYLLILISLLQLTSSKRQIIADFKNGSLFIDGERIVFLSGEMHYFRTPREQWKDRLAKMYEAGIKVVSTPIEWATHQPYEDEFVFSGEADIEYFLQLAHDIGLYVIVRCGPYIDSDRNFGGLPMWLLFKQVSQDSQFLRSLDSAFRVDCEKWLSVLIEKLKPWLYVRGGPIILIQIDDNNYDEIKKTCNLPYLRYLFEFFQSHFKSEAMLTTKSNSASEHLKCFLESVLQIVSVPMFNSTDNLTSLLIRYEKITSRKAPIMIDIITHTTIDYPEKIAFIDIEKINKFWIDALNHGIPVNYYMFIAGTNFGFSAGNSPNVASMGYNTAYYKDAPITVTGFLQPQYYTIKTTLARNCQADTIQLVPNFTYPPIELEPFGSLFATEIISRLAYPTIVKIQPLTFRQMWQGSGFVLYETKIRRRGPAKSYLTCSNVADRAYVFLRNNFIGYLTPHTNSLLLDQPRVGDVMRIFVENCGRHSTGFNLFNDIKGISGPVRINGKNISAWYIYKYSFSNVNELFEHAQQLPRTQAIATGPRLYRGEFRCDTWGRTKVADGFLDLKSMGHGVVFVNEFNLGRYWSSTNRQTAVYVPGCYLKPYPKINRVIVLELEDTDIDVDQNIIHFTMKPDFEF